jgi:hypothetical protein
MTTAGDEGAGRRPVDRRIGRDRSGPPTSTGAGDGRVRAALFPRDAETRRLDAAVFEAVELGGVLAEESVVPHVRLRGPSTMRGSSSVMIDLLDPAILASFRRQALLRRCATFRCWTVERRWSEAFSDLELDEQMCRCVAIHLSEAFRGRLRTRVISYVA